MADFISCGADLDLQTILMSLYDVVLDISGSPTDAGLIRIVEKTEDTSTDAVLCVTGQTFLDLFRQCIHLADDGRPALRVTNTDYANGSGIATAWSCAAGNSMQDTLYKIFCITTDGETAIRLANIT